MFNERGLEVSLDEIARHAGVGVGTVYRRFRTKEELIEALFMDRLDRSRPSARRPWRRPDAWSGLVSFMERMAETMAGDLGLRQMLMFATYGRDLVAVARQRNAPLVERLVQRAQAAGQLRADIRQTDITVHRLRADRGDPALGTPPTPNLAPVPDPDPGRHAAGREGATPLPVPAMLPEEMEKSMRQAAPRRR